MNLPDRLLVQASIQRLARRDIKYFRTRPSKLYFCDYICSYPLLPSIISVMSERALDQLALVTSICSEESSSSLVESELVCLVQEPDATLVVHHMSGTTAKRFSVSTTILKLASRYFDRLFYGHMAEAQPFANTKTVVVDLDGDEPSAVEVILRVLHHQMQGCSINFDMELLANIALHADKYDVSAVLEPWITRWLDALQPTGNDPIDIGLFLLATYRVGAISRYQMASSLASRELAKGFERLWSSHELLQHIPANLLSKDPPCN